MSGAPGPVVQTPPPPQPEALAVARYLKRAELKPRTCILQGQRKELFKVKRAIRALQTDAYKKASTKNPLLPKVETREQALAAFSLLPRNLMSLRVSKIDPPPEAKAKRVKGLWNVKIEQQQQINEDFYYCWLWEERTWWQTAAAVGLVVAIMAVVLFPLWPMKMRLGGWYLSMGMVGLIGLFILMSIFRLILFGITVFAVPPGLWLYPNLFEDVGFFDSFRPVWAWHNTKKPKKQSKKKAEKVVGGNGEVTEKTVATTTTKPAPPVAVQSSGAAPPRPTVEDGE